MSDEWDLARLRPHPENAQIFSDPEDSEQFDSILASIRKHGIWEPLAAKADGTIVSGHLRYRVAQKLKLKTVPVRVVPDFASYRDEVEYLIRCNTDRRQLTPIEIGHAFDRLKKIPREDGGAKQKRGRPGKGATSSTFSKSRDESASILGVSRNQAESLAVVAATPGVPDELKAAVNSGKVKPTPAAKAVRLELKRQGGELADPSALQAIANKPPSKAKSEPEEASAHSSFMDHERRMRAESEAYERDFRLLWEAYKTVDGVLSRRPPKSVLGPTEHHQYAGLVRDFAIRTWREIEAVVGATDVGRQMSLTVINGGKS